MQPIAIVGMAFRFPQGLEDVQSLLHALRTKMSAIDKVPADRWSVQRYFSSDITSKGKAYIQRGGFLTHNIKEFDAQFFGISPRDAENMDPQQRLLLEVVWEAFENGGLILPEYAGRNVGVYVGGFMLDHMISQMSVANRSAINQNTAAGMMMTMLSNRVSHTFDFKGPSLSIDTACSSSLVAFHYACQDIWHGNAETAVVGGANVMLRPEYPIGMCKGQFLARNGESKSFDSRADGYGRGEGAAAIVLKPLEHAIRDNDPIIATVLATGVNQDGRTPGISMPSQAAQEALIREVCSKYHIDAKQVRYVECHGTGTAVGDPIESCAIGNIYGAARKGLPPVILGSIKSNIGHLEAAAGVAGIIKAALTANLRQATPIANLQQLNPAIRPDELNVRIADELIDIGHPNEEFCVAVNSFGYGGTNAHAILHTPPRMAPNAETSQNDSNLNEKSPLRLLPLSARSASALSAYAARLSACLANDANIDDLLYSSSFKRAHLSVRAIIAGQNRKQLIEGLDKLAKREDSLNVISDAQPFSGKRNPVLVFTGMGPQWWGMGQELFRESDIYREAVTQADEVFKEVSGFSALAEMQKTEETSEISRTEFAQPANLLIQIGIWSMLKHWGVTPGAVVGHSVGELAAAYVAGVLSLHDVMQVCYHRSRLQARCAGTGGMLAAGIPKAHALEIIQQHGSKVSIAAINGPNNITFAGDSHLLARIAEQLTEQEKFYKPLEVEIPYHSPMMDPILHELCNSLNSIHPRKPTIPLYSTVSGKLVQDVSFGSDYWPENVRMPVDFVGATESILDDGFNMFLEVGPHPVLASSLRDCIAAKGRECRQAFTLRRNQPEFTNVLRGAMSVYAMGCNLDWFKHNARGKFISLPNYQWQREYLWNENERAQYARISPTTYPMLGEQEAPAVPTYRLDFDHQPVHYLRDHVVSGLPVLPAAAYVESLLEIASVQYQDTDTLTIRDFEIHAPLVISNDRAIDFTTTFDAKSKNVTIRSIDNGKLGEGLIHVTGTVFGSKLNSLINPPDQVENKLQQPAKGDLRTVAQTANTSQDITAFYSSLEKLGLEYKAAFQTVEILQTNDTKSSVLAKLTIRPAQQSERDNYILHPTLLDGAFQSLITLLEADAGMFLPTGFEQMIVYCKRSPESVWCHCSIQLRQAREIRCNLTLLDDNNNIVAAIHGMRLRAAERKQRVDQFGDPVKRQTLQYQWSYGEILSDPKRLGHWLLVGDDDHLAAQLAVQLSRFGATVTARLQFPLQDWSNLSEYDLDDSTANDPLESYVRSFLTSLGDFDGVVFFDGLKSNPTSDDPIAKSSILRLLTVARQIAHRQQSTVPRCYVLTQQAFSVNDYDAPVNPSQTAINGFVRVAHNELAGCHFTTIDIPEDPSDEILDNLGLELVCDSRHDEVALRGPLRLTSELLETNVLNEDRIITTTLHDGQPIQVRALRTDVASVGSMRLLQTSLPTIDHSSVQLRIERCLLPKQLLSQSPSSSDSGIASSQMIPVVGRIIAIGDEILDLTVGARVCGLIPLDVASHVTVKRNQLAIVEIPEEADGAHLVATLEEAVRAEFAVSSLDLSSTKAALVWNDSLGERVANLLAAENISVKLVGGSDPEAISQCHQILSSPLTTSATPQGYDLVAVPANAWYPEFGFVMAKHGAILVDLDATPSAVQNSNRFSAIQRTDLESLRIQTRRLSEAVRVMVEKILQDQISPQPALDISVADLAWQKLTVGEIKAALVLNFTATEKELPIVAQDHINFDPNATYLITGGFGGFGKKTAEWLIANGAKHIVLTGRTGADNAERRAVVRDLIQQGASVTPVACDASNLYQVKALFNETLKTLPPLKGVFHSAAQIIDQTIEDLDSITFSKVMDSKALGAWHLHLMTRDLNLDYFVMYSSVANLIGNSRQAAYASANGFLNGLAEYRQRFGLPALSVQWGAIADVGVVAKDIKLEQFLRYTGLRGLPSNEGLELMKVALARRLAQFGVTVVTSWADWARFEVLGGQSPRFATLISSDTQIQDSSVRDSLVEELSQCDPAERLELLSALLTDLIANVLKADPGSVPTQRALNQLGVDSLMATEIQLALTNNLGLNVSVVELLGDTSIQALASKSLKTLVG